MAGPISTHETILEDKVIKLWQDHFLQVGQILLVVLWRCLNWQPVAGPEMDGYQDARRLSLEITWQVHTRVDPQRTESCRRVANGNSWGDEQPKQGGKVKRKESVKDPQTRGHPDRHQRHFSIRQWRNLPAQLPHDSVQVRGVHRLLTIVN